MIIIIIIKTLLVFQNYKKIKIAKWQSKTYYEVISAQLYPQLVREGDL